MSILVRIKLINVLPKRFSRQKKVTCQLLAHMYVGQVVKKKKNNCDAFVYL